MKSYGHLPRSSASRSGKLMVSFLEVVVEGFVRAAFAPKPHAKDSLILSKEATSKVQEVIFH